MAQKLNLNRQPNPGQEILLYQDDGTGILGNAGKLETIRQGSVRIGKTPAVGDWIVRGNIRQVVVVIECNQTSAAAGVVIEESMDGTNVDVTPLSAQLTGGTPVDQAVDVTMRYFRFRYTNGAVPTTRFDCQVTGKVITSTV